MSPVREERDPGLQPERTRLAWRRTTLSVTVAGVLAARTALAGGPSAGGVVVCALCAALWLALLVLAHTRMRDLAVPRPAALSPVTAGAAALCTVALAVCATVLVVV
ncbi:DUF202 domain-containing protein [Streptomyces sp. CRN 30]|uniref:DUF202 domain-containing protein n=1 Tax=Streptomyces sp. CRN 30 TaxID=3075613 RepID=UPI002A8331C3|nr:DUF202 domain-containing protein [Streptomyces sp. CRN 30]